MLNIKSEQDRVYVLKNLDILDTTPEQPFDTLVGTVAGAFDMPICAISLVSPSHQWFKASVGLDISEVPRHVAFCDHTIRDQGSLVVTDTHCDDRFNANPLVTGSPFIRFYAGASILSQGFAIGALCVCDHVPRPDFSTSDERRLRGFAKLASEFIHIRKEGWPDTHHYHYVD